MPYVAGAYYVRTRAMAVRHHISLEAEFDSHDAPPTKYILALDGVLPVATCRMYPISADRMLIGRVVVLEEYRHRGLGTLVVREAEGWAKELGYRVSVVDSRDNKVPFYEKLGYGTVQSLSMEGTFPTMRMEKVL